MEFKTLNQFILEKQGRFPFATGELSRLLTDIALAAKVVNRAVNKAGLADVLGDLGVDNVQGERQQKLDVFADEVFMTTLKRGKDCCFIASEEHAEAIDLGATHADRGKYIVCIDPLDGSSNIDVNVSVGSIFSILKCSSASHNGEGEILQPGHQQIAAGYILYGSSTMLVYTTGDGVNGFTLDPSLGEFCLSHPDMQIPYQGTIYSINEGNYIHFPMAIKRYIKYCEQEDSLTNRPYSSRYIGSLVADIHRTLLKGGIFIYPETLRHPDGKLRLLYECNPMAFLIEQAGGRATTGYDRVLDIRPHDLHQRCPLIIGSKGMVDNLLTYYDDQACAVVSTLDEL